jgi:hypothetical protein
VLALYDSSAILGALVRASGTSYFNGGNVGIGTSAPTAKLNISDANPRIRIDNTNGTASTIRMGADSGNTWIGSLTNSPMYFSTNDSERMRITETGNVGIGTTVPEGKLHVNGGQLTVSGGATNNTANSIRLDSAGGNSRVSALGPDTITMGNFQIDQYSSNGSVGRVGMYIAGSTGNVGIGNITPNNKLELTSAAANTSGLPLK